MALSWEFLPQCRQNMSFLAENVVSLRISLISIVDNITRICAKWNTQTLIDRLMYPHHYELNAKSVQHISVLLKRHRLWALIFRPKFLTDIFAYRLLLNVWITSVFLLVLKTWWLAMSWIFQFLHQCCFKWMLSQWKISVQNCPLRHICFSLCH